MNGERYSGVIPDMTDGEDNRVCDFLLRLDPAVRDEIAEYVTTAKAELDHEKPRKLLL
ncbi:MAG: hypothetical protein GYA23_08805 [Methanomicrobiales archaeon]|nr:hypothetical protein [Methanomicrobiales archaeon]